MSLENRKVYRLLEAMPERERRKLDAWLEMEISEKQDQVLVLYKLLKKDRPLYEIWKAVFPDRCMPDHPLNDTRFRRLENHLTTHIESFLAWQKFRKHDGMRDIYLVQALNERNADNLYLTEWKKVRKRIERQEIRDSSYYQLLYELEKDRQFFQTKLSANHEKKDRKDYYNNFDAWWLHEKLRLSLVRLGERNDQEREDQSKLMDTAFQYIKNNPTFREMPVIQIYLNTYELLAQQKENHQLVELLAMYGNHLRSSERRDIFVALLNYYLKKYYRDGGHYFSEQLYYLYDWGLREKLLIRDGVLDWRVFRGIASLWLELGKSDDALHFIQEYKQMVTPKEQQETYDYCLAFYHFCKGAYRLSIRSLNRRYTQISTEVIARFLRIKAKYELGERVELENELRALQVFIKRRSDLNTQTSNQLRHDLSLMERLLRISNLDEVQTFQQKIRSEGFPSNRDWFRKKGDEMAASIQSLD